MVQRGFALLDLVLKRIATTDEDELISLTDLMKDLDISQEEFNQMDEVEFEAWGEEGF